jgi:gas vesicle protein
LEGEKTMRRKNHNKRSAGKVITGILLGSVIGATVGWLTAPTSGREMRRRIQGEVMSARERAKSAVGNVESRARELAAEVNEQVDDVKGAVTRRKKTASTTTQTREPA